MYQFIIPNKNLVTYQVFAYGIMLLNLLGFFVYNTGRGYTVINGWPMLGALLLIGTFELLRYRREKKLLPLGVLILIAGISWASAGWYLLLFLNLALGALYWISRRQMTVTVSEESIVYPSFPSKFLKWGDVNNVVLKDDMLTIDLKNNKIYQHLIEYPANEVNEPEFNDFCRRQLMVHS